MIVVRLAWTVGDGVSCIPREAALTAVTREIHYIRSKRHRVSKQTLTRMGDVDL